MIYCGRARRKYWRLFFMFIWHVHKIIVIICFIFVLHVKDLFMIVMDNLLRKSSKEVLKASLHVSLKETICYKHWIVWLSCILPLPVFILIPMEYNIFVKKKVLFMFGLIPQHMFSLTPTHTPSHCSSSLIKRTKIPLSSTLINQGLFDYAPWFDELLFLGSSCKSIGGLLH